MYFIHIFWFDFNSIIRPIFVYSNGDCFECIIANRFQAIRKVYFRQPGVSKRPVSNMFHVFTDIEFFKPYTV